MRIDVISRIWKEKASRLTEEKSVDIASINRSLLRQLKMAETELRFREILTHVLFGLRTQRGKSSEDAALAAVIRVLEEPYDETIGVEDIPPYTYMKVLKRNSRRESPRSEPNLYRVQSSEVPVRSGSN